MTVIPTKVFGNGPHAVAILLYAAKPMQDAKLVELRHLQQPRLCSGRQQQVKNTGPDAGYFLFFVIEWCTVRPYLNFRFLAGFVYFCLVCYEVASFCQ